jgi:hypothetical protein
MTREKFGQPSGLDAGKLISDWAEHLGQEEILLTASLQVLQQVRAALVQDDQAALTQANQQQEEMVKRNEELGEKRARLLQATASLLGTVPQSVTLRTVTERFPGDAALRLLDSRDRLRKLAVEVDEWNRGNALVVGHCLHFVQEMLRGLTHCESTGACYGPAGLYQETSCGSILSARG